MLDIFQGRLPANLARGTNPADPGWRGYSRSMRLGSPPQSNVRDVRGFALKLGSRRQQPQSHHGFTQNESKKITEHDRRKTWTQRLTKAPASARSRTLPGPTATGGRPTLATTGRCSFGRRGTAQAPTASATAAAAPEPASSVSRLSTAGRTT